MKQFRIYPPKANAKQNLREREGYPSPPIGSTGSAGASGFSAGQRPEENQNLRSGERPENARWHFQRAAGPPGAPKPKAFGAERPRPGSAMRFRGPLAGNPQISREHKL